MNSPLGEAARELMASGRSFSRPGFAESAGPQDRIMITRPTWDEYFLSLAALAATRSTCLRRQVGAVLVADRRVLTTGYNGSAEGLPHCEEVGCLREALQIPSGQRHEICRAIHAEQNAIIQAARHGVVIVGATLYCTTQPCIICAKMLINAGVVRMVFRDPYPDEFAQEILTAAGFSVASGGEGSFFIWERQNPAK